MSSELTPAQKTLADKLHGVLPYTQCTKCGYDGCRPYAEAMARGEALHNRCPPGGAEGVARLAVIVQQPIVPLNPQNGVERPRPVAVIDPDICIGCTLCIQACPVDAIIGAPKQLHAVVADLCTGCDLCVEPCPVDCIQMVPVTTTTGWAAWSEAQAKKMLERYNRRNQRLQDEEDEKNARLSAKAAALKNKSQDPVSGDDEAGRKKALIAAALARVKIPPQ